MQIKDGTCFFCLLPRKLHYPWKAMWLQKALSGSKEAIHKDKLSVSRKWSCYQTVNCGPHFLWIFEWVTENSSVNSKQLWQVKLPWNQESSRTMMKISPVTLCLSLPWVCRGTVSDLFYSNRSYKKSDLSLHFQNSSSSEISWVILNSLKYNDF